MDPRWNKRKRPFDTDDFFGFDIDEHIRQMEEHMARIMEEAMKAQAPEEGKESKSFVYGFSMKTGPDGKPVFEEFGNVPRGPTLKVDELEPLVDVIEGVDDIKVIAEIPGVEKEDIDINLASRSVEIRVDTPKKKYHKEIKLPAEVKTEDSKAIYKNGILEVTLKRIQKKKPSKTRINVE